MVRERDFGFTHRRVLRRGPSNERVPGGTRHTLLSIESREDASLSLCVFLDFSMTEKELTQPAEEVWVFDALEGMLRNVLKSVPRQILHEELMKLFKPRKGVLHVTSSSPASSLGTLRGEVCLLPAAKNLQVEGKLFVEALPAPPGLPHALWATRWDALEESKEWEIVDPKRKSFPRRKKR